MRPRRRSFRAAISLAPKRVAGVLAGDHEQAQVLAVAREPFSPRLRVAGPVAAASATALPFIAGLAGYQEQAERVREPRRVLVGRQRTRPARRRPCRPGPARSLAAAAPGAAPAHPRHRPHDTPARRAGACRAMPHCRSARYALQHGRDALGGVDRQDVARGPRPRLRRCRNGASRVDGGQRPSRCRPCRAGSAAARRSRRARRTCAGPARPGRCDAPGSTIRATAQPCASAARTASSRSSISTAPASTATPARPRRHGALDRARTDGRHVDAQLLTGLGALGQHAAARQRSSPRPSAATRSQHGVGALRTFDRQHPAVRDDHRLAGIERAQRRPHGKAQPGVGMVPGGQRDGADLPGASQQVGRHLVGAAHRQAFAPRRSAPRGVSTESSPPASRPRICGRLVKKPASGRIFRRVGPRARCRR